MIHFVHKGRNQHMTRHKTVTRLNYRMAVSGRSDFFAYNNFPEVYHGQGISKAAFSGGERPVTGQGRDTTYRVTDSWKNRYILCCRAAVRRWGSQRSGTWGFRIHGEEMRKQNMRSISICHASAYGRHTHMFTICIWQTYAYVYHLHM